jgi:hypothetical protein
MSVHEDGSATGASSEQPGLALLHQARQVRDLDAAQVERIARRLRGPTPRARRALLVPALLALALVTIAGATLAVAQGGLSALPVVGALFAPRAAPPPAEPSGRPRRLAPPREEAPAAPMREPPVAAPALQPPPAMPPASPQRPPPERLVPREARPVLGNGEPPTEAPAPGGEDPVVAESRAFATVIESWRRQRDAGTALVLLAAYDQRYPSGHMRLEARVLRAEIYLVQGKSDAALSVLDVISLAGLPRARELATVRGELRAKAGRCREAKADLGNVLESSLTDALARRATQALAHCP